MATRNARGPAFDPRVVSLTRSLGLTAKGDCLAQLRHHALTNVDRIVSEWSEPIGSLDLLLQIVAARLSVCIEYIRSDADIERISRERSTYSSTLFQTLQSDFGRGTTEGLLIAHEDPRPGDRRFLVVVDARGERGVRAYFTAWHEIAHVLTTPPQLEFKLFRRTPAFEEIRKDPVESAVDHVAGALAFYGPIFRPVLEAEVRHAKRLTFGAIERARETVAPSASTYAASVAAVRSRTEPACFVRAEIRLKPSELRRLRSPQAELGLGLPVEAAVRKLRLVDVIMNASAQEARLQLHDHLRVPMTSAIFRVHAERLVSEVSADEDQSQWETTADGRLPGLQLHVSAVRRGEAVYALVLPV